MPYPDQVERWRPLVRRHTPADLQGDPGFERVALAVLMAESGGNPSAPGDRDKRTGQPHSIGLYQLHDEGMGSGLSVQQRSDPDVNAGRAVPAIAAAYRRNRGDVTRTYVEAINPGALPDGPQVRTVLAAYAQGGGGGPKVQAQVQGGTVDDEGLSGVDVLTLLEQKKGKPVSVTPRDPTVKREPQTPAEKYDPNFQRESPNREPTYRFLFRDGTYVDIKASSANPNQVVGGTALKDIEDAETPASTASRKPTFTGGTGSNQKQILKVNPDGSYEWIDNPNYVEPTDKTATPTPPRSSRTYEVGGVKYTDTASDTGGFLPLPGGITDPNAMTPYQSAQLPIQRQNAASSALSAQASYLQAQVAQGRLSYDQAKQVFDYVVAQKAPVEEGGKLYVPGRNPSNENRRFFGLSEQPYSVVDAASFFNRPDLNQHVRGPYPFGQGPMSPEEYNARQAGTFQGAQPGAASPPSPAGGPASPVQEPAAGGFQPQMQAPAQMPQAPTSPQFGGTAALMQQQEALMRDTENIRQMLMSAGFSPQTAARAAEHYFGRGRTMATTPF